MQLLRNMSERVQVTPSFQSKKDEKHFRETDYTTSIQP